MLPWVADRPVVPQKRGNARRGKGPRLTHFLWSQDSLSGMSNTAAPEAGNTVSTKLAGLVALAKKDARLTNVVQYVDEELLRLAFRSLRKQAAAGVDGQTYTEYEEKLDQNLKDLYS